MRTAPHCDATPLIELQDLRKSYSQGGLSVEVLRGVSLSIHEGDYVAIMGASGSGKTTLMNLLGCLDTASSGRYFFEGKDVAQLDRDSQALLRRDTFGFIFQRYHLINHASATENVEIPAIYAGVGSGLRTERAQHLLSSLGLSQRLAFRPNQLSGGQQQRVSVARALMNGGRVILADEPTGALDSKSGEDVMNLLRELNRDGHTVILITHDPKVAAHARRLIEIKDGEIVADRVLSDTTSESATHAAAATARRFSPSMPSGRRMPDVIEAVKMAIRSLRSNLFRTALTLLGIVIGVGSVVTMSALGDGGKRAVLSRIEAMGSDLLLIRPGARGIRISGEPVTLLPQDAEAIAELPNVAFAVPEYNAGATLRAGGSDYVATVISTTADYSPARKWPLARGSFFSEDDLKSHAPVAVLGQTVRANLFGVSDDPIGRYLWVNNIPFQVVGVMSAKGATTSGSDMDDVIFIPLTTGKMRLFGKNYVRSITVQVNDVNRIDATQQTITTALTQRHTRQDFQIRNMADLLDTATETQNTLTVLLGSIAAISLLVGGIGVMNIMLVSVTERVREIGIRMATGARAHHIMLQFGIEALAVCLVGGVLGVLGGLGVAQLLQILGRPVEFSLMPVALAFASALATGMIFGYLPARKAASMDPVAALNAE